MSDQPTENDAETESDTNAEQILPDLDTDPDEESRAEGTDSNQDSGDPYRSEPDVVQRMPNE